MGSRHFYLNESGEETIRLLNEIKAMAETDSSGFWALRARRKLKPILKHRRASLVSFIIATTSDDQMRLVALWVRGHLKGTLGTSVVAEAAKSKDASIRKAAVRALKKMGGYAHLRELVSRETDPRIKRLCMAENLRPLSDRLQKFKRNVSSRDTSQQAMPLVVHQPLDLSVKRLPKPATYIRRILKEIKLLVRRQSHRSH